VFFFFWLQRGQLRKFFPIASATILLGWAWPLIVIPGVFIHKVLDYSSIWGTWGLSAILRLSGMSGMDKIYTAMTGFWIGEILKLIVIAGVFALAWRRRACEPIGIFTTLSLSFVVFFVFAPGFCVQYLIWFTPFMLVQSERWYAALTAASSVALFAFYTVVSGGLPWDKAFEALRTVSWWVPWLLAPWLAFTACLIATRRQWTLTKSEAGSTPAVGHELAASQA